MLTLAERFWAKVDKSGGDTACWPWRGYRINTGYGQFRVGSRRLGTLANVLAHRVAYELAIGPIPSGFVIDHLCRMKECQNPTHLEAVTQRENTVRGTGPAALNAAKTHCPTGHEYTDANTKVATNRYGYPFRVCTTCRRERDRRANAA